MARNTSEAVKAPLAATGGVCPAVSHDTIFGKLWNAHASTGYRIDVVTNIYICDHCKTLFQADAPK